mmetsp:Transcript_37059/g.84288  ORF Transcript_37059/g.84288 Transcript_37059/m.84288 type:complete len:373 (-) Transcript_37059:652-1770(-)
MHDRCDQFVPAGLRERRHHPKVEVREIAVLGLEEVARVRIRVEEPVVEKLLQVALHADLDQLGPGLALYLRPPRPLRRVIALALRPGRLCPLDPFHGEDLAGAEIGVDAWHHQPFDVPVQLPESDRVIRLLVIIDLLEKPARKLVKNRRKVRTQLQNHLPNPRDAAQDVHIERDERCEPRALNLDSHLLSWRHPAQPRPIHLAEGRRGHGRHRQPLQHLSNVSPEVSSNDPGSLLRRERTHIILQRTQCIHVLLPHQVRPVGERLPDLDPGWPCCRQRRLELAGASLAALFPPPRSRVQHRLDSPDEKRRSDRDDPRQHRDRIELIVLPDSVRVIREERLRPERPRLALHERPHPLLPLQQPRRCRAPVGGD